MFKPKKSLGQNFLIDQSFLPLIIGAAELNKKDTVIEIGPGTGILTEELVKNAAMVFAIEKDFELVDKLRKSNLGKQKNLKLIHQDALLFDLTSFSKFKIVANIPYNITSPLIRKFIEGENKPELLVLMVQKEVAERIAAKPGNSDRGLLTLIVEFFAKAEIIANVPKKSFFPAPSVDSAIIKIKLKNKMPDIEPKLFFSVVKAGFSSKRRQIHNSLAGSLRLSKDQTSELMKLAKIAPEKRAEDLTFEQWIDLSKAWQNINS